MRKACERHRLLKGSERGSFDRADEDFRGVKGEGVFACKDLQPPTARGDISVRDADAAEEAHRHLRRAPLFLHDLTEFPHLSDRLF